LENHHISLCMSILGMNGCDVFENWNDDYRKFVRNLVSNSILATDMRLHDDVLGELKDLAVLCKGDGGADGLDLLSITAAAATFPTAEGVFSEELHYQLLLTARIILHAADISNTVRPFNISSCFLDYLVDEWDRQLQQEERQSLPISTFMVVPDEAIKAKGELYFLNAVSRPFFLALADVFPCCSVLVETLDENTLQWNRVATSSVSF